MIPGAGLRVIAKQFCQALQSTKGLISRDGYLLLLLPHDGLLKPIRMALFRQIPLVMVAPTTAA